AAVHLADDAGELVDLERQHLGVPAGQLARERPLQPFRSLRRAIDVEQVLHVPERDVVAGHGRVLRRSRPRQLRRAQPACPVTYFTTETRFQPKPQTSKATSGAQLPAPAM